MTAAAWLTKGIFRLPGCWQNLLRVLLSHYVLNGLMVSLGLVLIVLLLLKTAGLQAAATAAVGVLITSLPDVPSPRRRKIMQMLPAPLLGAPLFVLVQLVRGDPPLLGLVLCAGTFLAVMLMAWGQRGGPVCYALLISMMLSMAAHPVDGMAALLQHGGWFLVGAVAYLLWGVLAAHLLNRRFRQQLLAECLASFAGILRSQAQRFGPAADHPALLAKLLAQQAVLVEQLQSTRDMVLESPTLPHRIRQAAALMALLEARDQQLACDLELDAVLALRLKTPAPTAALAADSESQITTGPQTDAAFAAIEQTLYASADQLRRLSMALLLGDTRALALPGAMATPATNSINGAEPAPSQQAGPAASASFDYLALTPSLPALLRQTTGRVAFIQAEAGRIAALLRGDAVPEIAAVQAQWQLFVSPTRWSIKPLLGQLAWRAATLRQALRMALAVGVGLAVALHLPWVAHEYWILLTIVVVMRANLAQTVQRRNDRVKGTLLGCVLVLGLLLLQPGAAVTFLVIALGLGISHAFVLRRYFFAATAATVGGLLQAHLLQVGISPTFAVAERIADTLLGAGLAWLFSYVLPVWERRQIPALVQRSLAAQLAHAHLALAWPSAAEQPSDMPWRLARREAYNSISELTLATQRTLAEPHTVQLALEPLQALQTQGYRLLAQLTAIKQVVLLHRQQLDTALAQQALEGALAQIGQVLGMMDRPAKASTPALSGHAERVEPLASTGSALDDVTINLTPWLLRRLRNAVAMAEQLQVSARRSVGLN